MDGLENDRNAVVQGVSAVAAVPMGLWEQTFGAFHQHQIEKIPFVLPRALPHDRFEECHQLMYRSLGLPRRGRGSHGIAKPDREIVG